ncbi:MAG: DNA polymerase III subunit gamma/tau [Candidatus Saccharibacteria bacterium]
MGKALYRTYRSKKLSEIVGQEHITQALTNALKTGTISHAYLFTGPRGTGKTSIARILAHEINGLAYDDDSAHLDIIEIDAASNRRIDEIRDLRDKVHIAPSSAKFKVYIIDEVHMLTREAFNALLKTLEEPPAHVVFILATTEVHKLPETIISRTQRFAFKPVDLGEVAAHLKHIATQEKIMIDDDALALVAAHGEGSFRDSISLLDQTRSVGHAVTAADIESILGIAPRDLITALAASIASHSAAQAIQTLHTLYDQGSDPGQVAKQLAATIRDEIMQGRPSLPRDQLMSLLTRLIEVPASSDPRTFLEVILLDAALDDSVLPTPVARVVADTPPPAATPPAPSAPPKKETPKPTPVAKSESIAEAPPKVTPKSTPTTEATQKPPKVAAEPQVKTEVSTGSSEGSALDISAWSAILAAIKAKNNTLYSLVKASEPRFELGKVTLTFGFAFHQKRINETHNKEIIAEAIHGVTGEQVQLVCALGEPKVAGPMMPPEDGEIAHHVSGTGVSHPPEDVLEGDFYVQQAEQEAAKHPITAISNIFGGGELLES